jgi:FMN-dependent NADH-azoreductase
VNASAQGPERSLTRKLGQLFVERWRRVSPDTIVVDRNLAAAPPPFVTEDWIAAAFTLPERRTSAMRDALVPSDHLISEVRAADVIVIGAPMYNYGMPAVLKAWFDQLARIGETFTFDLARGDWPIQPILGGKTLVVLSARGEFGFEKNGPRERMNALDPGIAACAHYLGVAPGDHHLVTIEFQEFKDARHAASRAAAEEQVGTLAESLSRRLIAQARAAA